MLKEISDGMEALGLNYAYLEWNDAPVHPYFVGEYNEFESMSEDGLRESTFILTGFNRGSNSELEKARQKIEKYFNRTAGKVVITDNSAVAIFYANAFPIRTGDAELKKIQINLTIKEWKVK